VNSINLGQPLVNSAPNSKVTIDLQNLASKLFEGAIEPAPSIPNGKKSFNSIFRRQTTIDDVSLTTALDRANLSEAQ
jgi:MinD-like ATPase involved in chromosome partitioning or flagellar assembly